MTCHLQFSARAEIFLHSCGWFLLLFLFVFVCFCWSLLFFCLFGSGFSCGGIRFGSFGVFFSFPRLIGLITRKSCLRSPNKVRSSVSNFP